MDCSSCLNKSCLKTRKPCQLIENELRKEGIYSADWIRPEMSSLARKDGLGRHREIGTNNIDNVATERACRIKYGKRPKKIDHEG